MGEDIAEEIRMDHFHIGRVHIRFGKPPAEQSTHRNTEQGLLSLAVLQEEEGLTSFEIQNHILWTILMKERGCSANDLELGISNLHKYRKPAQMKHKKKIHKNE